MRLASVETVFPAGLPVELPARSLQTPSQSASILKLAIMLPSAIALLVPFLLMAQKLATNEAFRSALLARPGAAVQLALGLAFWSLLFAWPLKRLANSVASMRLLVIEPDRVVVTDSGLLSSRKWEAPIGDYSGLAHHVRTSLSGVRHELVLVHPDRAKSVLVAIGGRFSQAQIDATCALLLCPEIPSKELYKFHLPAMSWPRFARPGIVAGSVT